MNYIKGTVSSCRSPPHPAASGYRYELYCLSKEHRTTHCVVELVMDRNCVVERNEQRPEKDRYEGDVLQKLMDRYEAPDSRNRWDSPLVPVVHDDIPMLQIESVLFDRTPPPPNLSTQSQPVTSSDYLTRLDGRSREVVQLILKALDTGSLTGIVIPEMKSSVSLARPVTSIELNKLRRQFMNYNKAHPATSDQQIIGNFVQFIQSNITESN